MNLELPIIVAAAANLVSATSRRVSELAARVPSVPAPPKAEPVLSVGEATPLPSPRNFKLTPRMISLLQHPLDVAGFKITDLEREFQDERILHSVAKNGGPEISMLALDPKDPPKGTAFAALEYFFPDGSFLRLLAEGLDVPPLSLKETIEKVWQSKPGRVLHVKWLPWTYIQALQELPTQTRLLNTLADLLEIQESGPAPAALQRTSLAPQDRIKLINLLAAMDDFRTTAARNTLLGLAELSQFADLPEGTARQVAGALLLKLEQAGGTPHPLRTLIDYLLLSDPGAGASKVLNDLLASYDFLQ